MAQRAESGQVCNAAGSRANGQLKVTADKAAADEATAKKAVVGLSDEPFGELLEVAAGKGENSNTEDAIATAILQNELDMDEAMRRGVTKIEVPKVSLDPHTTRVRLS